MADITKLNYNGTNYNIGDSKARQNIGNEFSTTTSYSTNDLVIYEGLLYKFTSDHSAGAWNSSEATLTNINIEKLSDAPSNGEEYVRKNGQWTISSGGDGNLSAMYYYEQTVNTATNAEIMRITDSRINTNSIILECTFADPSYITSNITWTSYDGYIAFTGTCVAATTANVTIGYTSDDNFSDRLMTLLWENSSPTSSFAAQTIQLDLSDYDEIMISFAHYTDDMTQSSYIIMKNDNWHPCRVMKSTYATDTYRNVKATNIGITFSAGFNPQTNQNDTSCAIPLKIYGISKNIVIQPNKPNNWKLIWSNPSPYSNFSAQDISFNANGCTELKIIFTRDTNSSNRVFLNPAFIYLELNNNNAFVFADMIDSSNHIGRRSITSINYTGLHFNNADYSSTYGTSASNSSILIPIYIYAR